MARLKLSLTISFLLLALASLNAEPTVIRPRTDRTKKNITLENKARIKPHGDSLLESNVQCFYLEGRLYFGFRQSEGNAKVSVLNAQTGREYTMTALSICPFSISVGEHPGYYLITLTTAKGNHYTGEYIIEE